MMAFCIGAMPIIVLLAAYNWHFLGAPWRSAQVTLDTEMVKYKTGSQTAGLWSKTPWVGAAG